MKKTEKINLETLDTYRKTMLEKKEELDTKLSEVETMYQLMRDYTDKVCQVSEGLYDILNIYYDFKKLGVDLNDYSFFMDNFPFEHSLDEVESMASQWYDDSYDICLKIGA